MGFWDTFKKTAAVGTAAGAAIGVTAMGISSLLGSKHKRKMTEKQMEIEERKQNNNFFWHGGWKNYLFLEL